MYAAAGGASLAGRKARQHGRLPAPSSPRPHSPLHPAPSGVRLYSCAHWESRLLAPPPTLAPSTAEPQSPCDVVECAAGRAAWQEAAALSVGGGGAGAGGAARRCSVLGDHPGARRDPRGKWIRNNRVRDASYGSSSESDGEAEGHSGEPWGVARLLYAGLAILALGLVVYFVGTGDKGFKTPALRLVGPSLIFTGLACCLLRIMFCIFAKPCCRRRTNYKENRRLSGGVEGEEMPLARGGGGGGGRGPAQCSPARRLDASSCDVSSLSSGEEDERMRRYRTPHHATLHPPTHQVTAYQSTSQQSAIQKSPSPSSLQPGAGGSPQPEAGGSPQQVVGGSPQTMVGGSPQPVMGGSLQPVMGGSPQPAAGGSPQPSVVGLQLQPSLGSSPHSPCSIAQGPPPPQPPSAIHQGPLNNRRPPPRNVSFASGPDGELVLSPAQLRS